LVTIPINVQEPSVDENIKRLGVKMDSVFEGAPSSMYFESIFNDMLASNPQNAEILSDFVLMEKLQQNLSQLTILNHIQILCYFSRYLHYKSFGRITKDDILSYLFSLRKPETDDPSHKWIGTYNIRQMILNKFFRWLYNQNEPDCKKWITPACIQGVRALPKKEKSPYKPSDIWNNEEHAIFLKYCPSKRDRCYHAMAHNTAARPKELLNLRIKDIEFKIASTGKQYAEVHIKHAQVMKTRSTSIVKELKQGISSI
jgi:integrase